MEESVKGRESEGVEQKQEDDTALMDQKKEWAQGKSVKAEQGGNDRDKSINMGRKEQHKALKTELEIQWKELRTLSKQIHNMNGNGWGALAEALWMLRRERKEAAESLQQSS